MIAAEPRVANYLDVPIQHVDSGVLKSMRRGYGEKQVRDLVERFRARVPDGTLRTTFIAGHPGETDAAFQRLCDFVREAELDHVGVFNFSREEGTSRRCCRSASRQKEIDARRRELLRIQRQVSKKKLGAMRGRVLRVLVEGASDESEYLLDGTPRGPGARDRRPGLPVVAARRGDAGRPELSSTPASPTRPSTTSPPSSWSA